MSHAIAIDVQTVLDAINSGQHDDHIEVLTNAVSGRKRAIRNAEVADVRQQVSVGDIVTVSDEVRPKYLAGQKAEVLKVNDKSVKVVFVDKHATGRYAYGEVRLPLVLVALDD